MSSLNLRLPESLHDQVRELAKRDKVSINQFVSLAVAEKVSALRTLDYIEQRGRQSNREQYERVLQRIVDANLDPFDDDRIPEDGHVISG